jgi:putative tricarboxylic transport membrane protein
MRVNDAVTGAVLVVLGGAVTLQSRGFPPVPGQQYGAAVFPTIVALALVGCGVLLIAQGVRRRSAPAATPSAGEERADWTRSGRAWFNLLTCVALVIGYIVLAPTLGFLASMTLLTAAVCLLLGVRWWVALVVGLTAALVIHQGFTILLRVPLPRGVVIPF